MSAVVSIREIGERVVVEFGPGLGWDTLTGRSQSRSARWARAVTAYLAIEEYGSIIGQREVGTEMGGRGQDMISQMIARVRDELKYRPLGPIAIIVEKCK